MDPSLRPEFESALRFLCQATICYEHDDDPPQAWFAPCSAVLELLIAQLWDAEGNAKVTPDSADLLVWFSRFEQCAVNLAQACKPLHDLCRRLGDKLGIDLSQDLAPPVESAEGLSAES
jgi:hypothetical protein